MKLHYDDQETGRISACGRFVPPDALTTDPDATDCKLCQRCVKRAREGRPGLTCALLTSPNDPPRPRDIRLPRPVGQVPLDPRMWDLAHP